MLGILVILIPLDRVSVGPIPIFDNGLSDETGSLGASGSKA